MDIQRVRASIRVVQSRHSRVARQGVSGQVDGYREQGKGMASAVVPQEVIELCQKRWCIISTDKLTQTTTVCCKYLVMKSAIEEYSNSTFYERVTIDPGQIITAHTQGTKGSDS